jgi:hypothetical protein
MNSLLSPGKRLRSVRISFRRPGNLFEVREAGFELPENGFEVHEKEFEVCGGFSGSAGDFSKSARMMLKDMGRASKGGKGFSGCRKMLPGWEKGALTNRGVLSHGSTLILPRKYCKKPGHRSMGTDSPKHPRHTLGPVMRAEGSI